MALKQRLWRMLAVLLFAAVSGVSAAQPNAAADHQAVIAWTSQRYQAMEQLAVVPLRIRAALQVAAGLTDGNSMSDAEIALLNDAVEGLRNSRVLLNDSFDALPPPPDVEDSDMARRLRAGIPIVQEAKANGLAQFDAAIDWLIALRNGDDPRIQDLQIVLVDAQIGYLEAIVRLFETTGSSDYTNPGTLDAVQRTATQWAQRTVLVLYRAELTESWTAGLALDVEADLDAVRQAIEYTISEIDLRASNSVAILDEVIASDPTISPAFQIYRDKVAELMETYALLPPAGESFLDTLDGFWAEYHAAESSSQRMRAIEAFLAHVNESAIRMNEVRSRRTQLAREVALLFDEL